MSRPTQSLELRQGQSLVMTPQLQQAIRLLQMSQAELEAHLVEALEGNPLLSRPEEELEASEAGITPEAPAPDAAAQAEAPDAADIAAEHLDTSPGDTWQDEAPLLGSRPLSGGGGEDAVGMDHWAAAEPSLRDHLLAQIGENVADPALRLVASGLVDLVDEAGWLPADLSGMAELLGCDAPILAAAVAALQRCEPAGIGGRGLKECLALQLRAKNRFDPAMAALVEHLELVAEARFDQLQKLCGVDGADLADMLAELRALDPRPGHAFSVAAAASHAPDVLVRRHPFEMGQWIVELNPDALPRVLIDRNYYARVAAGARQARDQRYLAERLTEANWLVRALEQRAETILKVATEIVRRQEGFFERGVAGLRPMVLRDIAGAIEMHESTVSRVTNGKFMATPRGQFELKYFFTTGLAAAGGGEAHSAQAVRARIEELIGAESPAEPLSDQALAEILEREGVAVARRTVAKYREGLGIPTSSRRRRRAAGGF